MQVKKRDSNSYLKSQTKIRLTIFCTLQSPRQLVNINNILRNKIMMSARSVCDKEIEHLIRYV